MTETTEITHGERLERSLIETAPKALKENKWGQKHVLAFQSPTAFEKPIVGLIRAAADYADEHKRRYESKVGDDGNMGDEWQSIVRAILGLLNGECGRLDCGTLDALLREMLRVEGFNPDE